MPTRKSCLQGPLGLPVQATGCIHYQGGENCISRKTHLAKDHELQMGIRCLGFFEGVATSGTSPNRCLQWGCLGEYVPEPPWAPL